MQITLSISNLEVDGDEGDILSLGIYPDMTVETLRSSIQAETRIAPTAQHLYHNGQLITDNSKTMEQLQIGDGDMLALHVRDMRGNTGVPAPAAGAATATAGGRSQPGPAVPQRGGSGGNVGSGGAGRPGVAGQDPELIRLQILGDARLRSEIQRQQPELGAALEDPQRFAQLFNENYERDRRERFERQQMINRLNEDPFDVEAQARIEEMIRQERVMENLQNALEHNPEVFGRVHMLYVDVEVNGHKVKAFVDSGAQATIMSPDCAEACGIMRLVDKRFAGVARGVGTANIIGRVHSAQIKISSLFLPCSFTVMEGKSVDLLLGLDMLKRHQACIDLAKDKLVIQGVEIPFLGEADIPKETEEALEEEPKVAGPGGTTIGARSGAVSAPSGPSGPSGAAAPHAAAAPPRNPQPRPAQPAAAANPYPEEHIQQLMALGATRQRAIQALQQTGGNVEWAAASIFED